MKMIDNDSLDKWKYPRKKKRKKVEDENYESFYEIPTKEKERN